jgi:protein TonB
MGENIYQKKGRFLFVLVVFMLTKNITHAQNNTSNDSIYNFENLDKEPVFNEGNGDLNEFIKKNIMYPKQSRKDQIEGKVYVQFVIEKNGKVTNIKILKGLNEDCNKEVIRIVDKMPRWKPGEKNNQPVRTFFNLPVKFSLKSPSNI